MTPFTFPREPQKELAVILWIANQSKNKRVDMYTLIKTVYDANKTHLNKYGRPVVGGNHAALPYGPIHDDIYNHIKSGGSKFKLNGKEVIAKDEPDMDEFSRSDLLALKKAWKKCRNKTFNEVHDCFSKDSGFLKAKKRLPAGKKAGRIEYTDMLTKKQTKTSKESLFTYQHFKYAH